jgi:hypothetical protein
MPAINKWPACLEVFDLQTFTTDARRPPPGETLKFYKISQKHSQMSTFFGSIPSKKLIPGVKCPLCVVNHLD